MERPASRFTKTATIRVWFYDRTFTTIQLSSPDATEALELIAPKLQQKWPYLENLKLFLVSPVDGAEECKPLELEEVPYRIKQQWPPEESNAHEPKYLFVALGESQKFIPFSEALPPEKEGYLTKLGEKSSKWQTRWFKLVGSSLSYYHSAHDETPRGNIDLQGAILKADANNGKIKFAFTIQTTGGRKYHIYASHDYLLAEWFEVLAPKVAQVDRSAVAVESSSASETPSCSGFMEKRGGATGTSWQKRWFELRGSTLYYYGEPPKANSTPKGSITLADCSMDENADGKFLAFCLVKGTTRNYDLAALDLVSYEKWIRALAQQVKMCTFNIDDNIVSVKQARQLEHSHSVGSVEEARVNRSSASAFNTAPARVSHPVNVNNASRVTARTSRRSSATKPSRLSQPVQPIIGTTGTHRPLPGDRPVDFDYYAMAETDLEAMAHTSQKPKSNCCTLL